MGQVTSVFPVKQLQPADFQIAFNLDLLEEVTGTLPEDEDKGVMLAVIDRYLALPDEKMLLFLLGVREGA